MWGDYRHPLVKSVLANFPNSLIGSHQIGATEPIAQPLFCACLLETGCGTVEQRAQSLRSCLSPVEEMFQQPTALFAVYRQRFNNKLRLPIREVVV